MLSKQWKSKMNREVLFDGRVASHYEDWFLTVSGQRADRLEKALLQRLLVSFGSPTDIVEVGYGTGHFGRWLSGLGWHVVGVDLSASMLTEARQHGDDGLLMIGDALHLPLVTGCCDLAVVITVLEFLPNIEAALRETWRVARRGILLGVINRHSLLGWGYRQQAKKAPTVYSRARFFTPGELKGMLQCSAPSPVTVEWGTTLFPGRLPWERLRLPWGGFIGMAARRR